MSPEARQGHQNRRAPAPPEAHLQLGAALALGHVHRVLVSSWSGRWAAHAHMHARGVPVAAGLRPLGPARRRAAESAVHMRARASFKLVDFANITRGL